MKRNLFILGIALFVFCSLKAAPAYPYPIKYTQPDGSVITIRLHGDEFWHYTTCNGRVVERGDDGFYHPASLPSRAGVAAARARTVSLRNQAARHNSVLRSNAKSSISIGEKRFLVLLIEFSDIKFTVDNPNAAFSALLNERGYSENGGTGSVYDYYSENSRGQFIPTYDVIGPITLNKTCADYGANKKDADGKEKRGEDKDPGGALIDACGIAYTQGLINFADYDNDGDGVVDNVFFYYAGYNEAEGANGDTIWPHASGIWNSFGGVYVNSYACSSEYRGNSGNTMAGIGTFCHEFGHVLGLPDLYDTDYEENGSATTVNSFSLMCDGNYNNNGRTPPYLGAMERYLLGWKNSIEEKTGTGEITVRPVYENDGFRTPTSVEGEFFLYEVRDGSGWDRYILTSSNSTPPKGMLVYHVDMSTTNMVGSYTAASLWKKNSINDYSAHPCYYIVRPTTSYSSYQDFVYPGTSNTTSFEGTDWARLPSGFKLSNITWNGNGVSLTMTQQEDRLMKGKVTDSKGRPMAGVEVSLVPQRVSSTQASGTARRFLVLRDVAEASSYTALTASDGSYTVAVPKTEGPVFTVSFSIPFYSTVTDRIAINGLNYVMDVVMYNFAESEPGSLCKHGLPYSALGYTNEASSWSGTMAAMFSASELTGNVGDRISAIKYMISGSKAAQVDVFVDFGAERVFTRKVNQPGFNSIQTIDISDADIRIPAGKDVYFGYAVKDITNQYWINIDNTEELGYKTGAGMCRDGYQTTGSDDWGDLEYNLIISAETQTIVSPFNNLGVRIISNPSEGSVYQLGASFILAFDNPSTGETAENIIWYYDGNAVTGSSITLSEAGYHTIRAVISYSDGGSETIEQQVLVQ